MNDETITRQVVSLTNIVILAFAFVVTAFVMVRWGEAPADDSSDAANGKSVVSMPMGRASDDAVEIDRASDPAEKSLAEPLLPQPQLILDRGNFRVSQCIGEGCESHELIYDNPYGALSLADLKTLAVSDATASFQFAVRSFIEAESPDRSKEIIEHAMRSVALATREDAAWYYAAAIEHLDLYQRSDTQSMSDEHLLQSYEWLKAGAELGFFEDDRYAQTMAPSLIERGLMDGAELMARGHALSMVDMRLMLSGEPLPLGGEQ